MWKLFSVLVLVGYCFLGAGTAGAISFEARGFDALAAEADQIIIGTVGATRARRTGEREIVTDYRFDDLQTVKGTVSAGSLTLTMLGGAVGTEALTVAGAPTFQPGIRYLVFITGNGSVMFPLVGGHQGIFQIRKDSASGVSQVHDYAGRSVSRLPGRAARALVDRTDVDAGDPPMTEAAFVDAIRARISGKGAQ